MQDAQMELDSTKGQHPHWQILQHQLHLQYDHDQMQYQSPEVPKHSKGHHQLGILPVLHLLQLHLVAHAQDLQS